jgi:hypothetical protein
LCIIGEYLRTFHLHCSNYLGSPVTNFGSVPASTSIIRFCQLRVWCSITASCHPTAGKMEVVIWFDKASFLQNRLTYLVPSVWNLKTEKTLVKPNSTQILIESNHTGIQISLKLETIIGPQLFLEAIEILNFRAVITSQISTWGYFNVYAVTLSYAVLVP